MIFPGHAIRGLTAREMKRINEQAKRLTPAEVEAIEREVATSIKRAWKYLDEIQLAQIISKRSEGAKKK